MGYTESGKSPTNQRIPCFAYNPDLNHALQLPQQPEQSGRSIA